MIVLSAFEIWRPAEMSPAGLSQHPETFSPIGGSMLVDAPARTVLVIGTSMGIARLSFHCLERPFLKLKYFFGDAKVKKNVDPSLSSTASQASGVLPT